MLKKQTVSELSNKKNIILNKQEQIHILFMIGQIAQISAQLRELCKNAGMSEYQYSDQELQFHLINSSISGIPIFKPSFTLPYFMSSILSCNFFACAIIFYCIFFPLLLIVLLLFLYNILLLDLLGNSKNHKAFLLLLLIFS